MPDLSQQVRWVGGGLEAGDATFELESLVGIKGLILAVDRHVEPVLMGPSEGEIEARATEVLLQAEVNVLQSEPEIEDSERSTHAVLNISYTGGLIIDRGPGMFVFQLKLDVWQAVRLERKSEDRLVAITWSTGVVGACAREASTLVCLDGFTRLLSKLLAGLRSGA